MSRGAAVTAHLLVMVPPLHPGTLPHHPPNQAGGGRVRLAILDHVVSMAPVQLPVGALCALCAGAGAATLVDGAHAVGALRLDLVSLGCDYYASNLHKVRRGRWGWA